MTLRQILLSTVAAIGGLAAGNRDSGAGQRAEKRAAAAVAIDNDDIGGVVPDRTGRKPASG